MKWYTHAAIGANAIWLTRIFDTPSHISIFYAVLGAFAALLPDIDAGGGGTRGAKIHYIGFGILGVFKGIYRHRGFFHSFISVVLVFCLLIPITIVYDPLFPVVFCAGYASHLFIDSWNAGMQFFYPLKKDVTFVPRLFRFRVGSSGDDLFFLIGVFSLVIFIFTYWTELVSSNLLFVG